MASLITPGSHLPKPKSLNEMIRFFTHTQNGIQNCLLSNKHDVSDRAFLPKHLSAY
jgi:hypothetical protein